MPTLTVELINLLSICFPPCKSSVLNFKAFYCAVNSLQHTHGLNPTKIAIAHFIKCKFISTAIQLTIVNCRRKNEYRNQDKWLASVHFPENIISPTLPQTHLTKVQLCVSIQSFQMVGARCKVLFLLHPFLLFLPLLLLLSLILLLSSYSSEIGRASCRERV